LSITDVNSTKSTVNLKLQLQSAQETCVQADSVILFRFCQNSLLGVLSSHCVFSEIIIYTYFAKQMSVICHWLLW